MGDEYYDQSSIEKADNNIVRVWTNVTLNKDGKKMVFSDLKEIDKAPDNPDKLKYYLDWNEIDCSNDRVRSASIYYYDDKHNVVYSSQNDSDAWHNIVPDSVIYILKNTVCSAGKDSGIKNNFQQVSPVPTAKDWINKAEALWVDGKYTDSSKVVEYLNNAIKLKSDDAVAYNNRGFAYYNLGQYQRAIDDFNKAISLKSDYTDAYNNRGSIYFTQSNFKKCCPDMQKACALGKCKLLEDAKRKGVCR